MRRHQAVVPLAAAVLALAIAPGIGQAARVVPANPFRSARPLVIPHGGGDGLFPENTMLAFEKTMAMGADVVDVDVSRSKDGVLIAFHDPTVTRITGQPGRVRDLTFAQLQRLDAGWAFTSAKKFPFRGKGLTIPSLEDILKRFPSALLSLDLKDESTSMNTPVCDLLTRFGRSNDVFVGSNNDAQILQFRQLCPKVRTSATMVDVYANRDARAANDPNYMPAVTVDQPPYRSGTRTLVDEASLTWAHAHGVAILTWVVNDPKDMEHLIDIGVDGIYTSYPDRLIALLKKRGKL
jgi:glycerophosphoryl diester phosphodiesterase